MKTFLGYRISIGRGRLHRRTSSEHICQCGEGAICVLGDGVRYTPRPVCTSERRLGLTHCRPFHVRSRAHLVFHERLRFPVHRAVLPGRGCRHLALAARRCYAPGCHCPFPECWRRDWGRCCLEYRALALLLCHRVVPSWSRLFLGDVSSRPPSVGRVRQPMQRWLFLTHCQLVSCRQSRRLGRRAGSSRTKIVVREQQLWWRPGTRI